MKTHAAHTISPVSTLAAPRCARSLLATLIAAALAYASPALVAQPVAPSEAAAEQPAPAALSAEAVQSLVTELADLLATYYVRPEVGQRYAKVLRDGLVSGELQRLEAPAAIAEELTRELQATAPDGHLRVIPPGAMTPQRMVMGGGPAPVESARWIAEGVAYLRLRVLPGNPEGVAEIERFLSEHATARTLIIDTRDTPGGSGNTADLIMSYLFAEPTPLLHMEMRNEAVAEGWAPFQEGPSVRRIAAEEGHTAWERSVLPHPTEHRLKDAQVFLLTSGRTASAAEALALGLKRTGRGVLIGENTYGAGHFTRPLEIGAGFTVNLPIGRTFDPDTGLGFEGSGVAPHVRVPAAAALEEALRRAGVDARQASR